VRRTLLAVLALALASACTSTRVLTPTSPRPLEAPSTKILLMPLDVELLELAAGGVMSPRADWTAAARGHLQKSIVARIERARASHVVAEPSLLAENSPHLQLFKLHETIGAAIYAYQAGGPNGQLPVLPTLKTGFDWTLGESVQPLGKDTGATHALFVFVRDSYATAGRKAAAVGAVLVGALTGMYVPVGTGVRVAFASLVDLSTGDVLWFNRLYSETGDLREAEPAAKATESLLEDFPL
jgi:hypothetical protein